jgi:hypothetical protein
MPSCKHGKQEIECEYCTMSVAWAIIKSGYKGVAYRWARAYLALDDQKVVYGSRAVYDDEREDRRVTR